MKKYRYGLFLLSAILLTAETGLTAFAQQSPGFAYSDEQWASLRDNKLEYEEIARLIHEYNPNVLQNNASYKEQLNKKSSDISQSYYDAAEQVYNNMNYPDQDSANYASGVTAYLNSQISYEKLREQGDKNTNDSETYKLDYDKQEAELVKQAKQLMVSYKSDYIRLDTLRSNISQAQQKLESVTRKYQAGAATENSVLTAGQELTAAQTALSTAEAALESERRSLILMLGWNVGDSVEIGALPEISTETIDGINIGSDTEKAKANNYKLRSLNRQLANAVTSNVREELTLSRDTAEKNIANNISTLYEKLKDSLTEQNAAAESLKAKDAELKTAELKKTTGMMTEADYNSAKAALDTAGTQLQIKKYAVLLAYINYESAVNGLAE